MAIIKVPTFCRVCEASCGLVAEKEDNIILSLRPDKSHPVTRGFSCPKGILAFDMHKDEDRLNYPLKRTNSRREAIGRFERKSWDEAADEISLKLQKIIQKYRLECRFSFFRQPHRLQLHADTGHGIIFQENRLEPNFQLRHPGLHQ